MTVGDLDCPRCEGTFAEGRACPRDRSRLVRLTGTSDPSPVIRASVGTSTVTTAPTYVEGAPKKRPVKKKVRPSSTGSGKMPF